MHRVIINKTSGNRTLLFTLLPYVLPSYGYQILNLYQSVMVWAVWRSNKRIKLVSEISSNFDHRIDHRHDDEISMVMSQGERCPM